MGRPRLLSISPKARSAFAYYLVLRDHAWLQIVPALTPVHLGPGARPHKLLKQSVWFIQPGTSEVGPGWELRFP